MGEIHPKPGRLVDADAVARGRGAIGLLALLGDIPHRPPSLLPRHVPSVPARQSEGIAVIPYNPIAGGLLSGKHVPTAPPPEGTRFTLGWAAQHYQERYWHERAFATVEELKEIANEAGLALPTLAVAWTMANPVVTAPIVGASRPEHLDATLAAADVTLDEDLLKRLDELTRGVPLR